MVTLQDQPLAAIETSLPPWETAPAAQQPQWGAHPEFLRTRESLAAAPPLVTTDEIDEARRALAAVARGEARVVQAGDCAESFDECTPAHIGARLNMLDLLGDFLEAGTDQPAVRLGRMGGQFAKPRSQPVETIDGVELPVFRGHIVNSPNPTPRERQHDPRRMLWAHEASSKVMSQMRESRDHRAHAEIAPVHTGPWSSHEALVMDYEASAVRTDPQTGATYLGSTHVPWIGERTRQPQSAHVQMLAEVRNPVGVKVGPRADVADVLRLCELLDPEREPGRLTLITRMGSDQIEDALPRVAAAVRQAGHPVVWLSDPMHGNTVRTSTGVKTRHLDDIAAEAKAFRRILEEQGEHAGGLHLEVAADDVTECIGGPIADEHGLDSRYTTLCDPRLNPEQAIELLEAWA